MEFLLEFANNFLKLLDAMSIYVMAGLLIAGILKQIIPDNFVASHLGKDSTSAVVKATIFGIPLPVCSCSVIPLAQGLKKEGASKGAVQSFLISTPITGVDSILATFSFFGLVFTVFRVITSVVIAITVGLIQNFIEKKDETYKGEPKPTVEAEDVYTSGFKVEASKTKQEESISCGCSTTSNSCCSSEPKEEKSSCCSSEPKPTFAAKDIYTGGFSVQAPKAKKEESSSCGCSSTSSSSSCCSSDSKKGFSFINALKYGYGTLFSDMAKSLLIGLVLGAAFTTFMPQEYAKLLFDNEILTYFVILVVAIPLYTCATASLPIAAALMLQGMSAGAAFVFLTAGPATSAVTMSVIYKMLGRTSLLVYTITIAVMALIFGYIFDTYFGSLEILNISLEHEESSLLYSLASLSMLILIIFHLSKDKFSKKTGSCCSSEKSESSCCCSSETEK